MKNVEKIKRNAEIWSLIILGVLAVVAYFIRYIY